MVGFIENKPFAKMIFKKKPFAKMLLKKERL
jgi:hypothetical protein